MASWKDALGVIGKLAPTIATVAGGPLAGSAVTALEGVFGLTPATPDLTQRQTEIAGAVAGATPDQLLALKKADNDFQAQMAQLGFANIKDLEALAVQDRESARQYNLAARDWTPRILGCIIVLAVLGISYGVLFHKMAAESALAGAVIGYLFNEAGSVTKFWFGGSRSSDRQTELIAQSTPVTPTK